MSVLKRILWPKAWRWRAGATALLAGACLLSFAVGARGPLDESAERIARTGARPLAEVSLASLPPEAAQTLALIKRGGPFPYPEKDGSVFGNFEKRLPVQPRGYYREYTVPTPGLHHRGARRIVAGQGGNRIGGKAANASNAADSGEYYYTGNHYRSFRRIREP